eukprot:5680574-Amphidinium_carterae.1
MHNVNQEWRHLWSRLAVAVDNTAAVVREQHGRKSRRAIAKAVSHELVAHQKALYPDCCLNSKTLRCGR